MKRSVDTAEFSEIGLRDKQVVAEFFKLLDQWEKNERKEDTNERTRGSSSMET